MVKDSETKTEPCFIYFHNEGGSNNSIMAVWSQRVLLQEEKVMQKQNWKQFVCELVEREWLTEPHYWQN